jgi:hypothetical protein
MRADVRSPVQDAALQGPPRALVYVLRCERRLCGCNLLDGLVEVSLDRSTAVQNAGLVEMEMGLHEPRTDEAPAQIKRLGVCGERGFDRGDFASGNADVHEPAWFSGQARIAEYKIHGR